MRLAGTLKHHHVDTHLFAHLVRLLSLLTIHRLIISQLSVYSVVQLTAHWWHNEVTQGNHSDANFQVNLQNQVIPAALCFCHVHFYPLETLRRESDLVLTTFLSVKNRCRMMVYCCSISPFDL